MATTISIGQGEAVTVSPSLVGVLGGTPERRVQLLFRRGVLLIDRCLTTEDAYQLGLALIAAAGDSAP